MTDIADILRGLHPEHEYAASSDFIGDRLLDSFDIVILVHRMEETFGISIDGEDIVPENFRNIEALKSLVERSVHVD